MLRHMLKRKLPISFTMKKLWLAIMISCCPHTLLANPYVAGGFGLGTACSNTQYDQDSPEIGCETAGIVLRGVGGNQFNDYFSAEFTLEGLISPWKLFGLTDVETERVSAFTLGGHAFLTLPLSQSLHLFLGPSVGASIVYTSWDVDRQYNYSTDREDVVVAEDYDFSWNYGWATGVEFTTEKDNIIRLQWQNWRHLESEIAYGGAIAANYLTLNFISRY
jgi:hypothetical protein